MRAHEELEQLERGRPVNEDVVGVELCAAAKNVIALAAGGADGLGLGDNAKAALVARGLAEMARFAEASGARPETFAGLAGMGDLIVTCWSKSGRNRRAGELIAQGTDADEAVRQIGMVVEGLTTAPVLRDLSHRLGIELPITEGVCRVLGGEPLHELVGSLMRREHSAVDEDLYPYFQDVYDHILRVSESTDALRDRSNLGIRHVLAQRLDALTHVVVSDTTDAPGGTVAIRGRFTTRRECRGRPTTRWKR